MLEMTIRIPQELADDVAACPSLEELIAGARRPSPPREHDPRKWPAADVRCLECGGESVRVEDDPGDYYVGPTHWCEGCRATFTCQPGGKWDGEEPR